MKTYTDKEIENKLLELFESDWDTPEFAISRDSGRVDIVCSREYSAPKLTFKHLNELARFFDTMNIETDSEFVKGGCETCDFGSSYGFTLHVSPGDPFTTVVSDDDFEI